MRISEYFGLHLPQAAIDFVDIDVAADERFFIDPNALIPIAGEWAAECRHLIQHFFQTVIDAVVRGDEARGKRLLAALREPNETHLGLSRGSRARGRGLGPGLAVRMWDSLSASPAVASGLLVDLQDTCLMVEGIDRDLISDITTNIIREPLIRYTQRMAELYGFPLEDVDSGPLWLPDVSEWGTRYEEMPTGPQGRLLLVPKVMVRQTLAFRPDDYYRHYILTHLQGIHLEAKSALVTVLKNGNRRVYKTRLEKEYGTGKRAAAQLTMVHPDVLERYREDKRRQPGVPLSHEELATAMGTPPPDWNALLDAVTTVQPGASEATAYHRAVTRLLQALWYPSLAFPEIEREIHDGRKRIDLVFTNQAQSGFFAHVRDNYVAPFIMIECKNYSADLANQELDQLSGRFSNRRGWVGILCSRSFKNKELFIARCRDTANDNRGFIVPLDDGDLATLVAARRKPLPSGDPEALLRERFNRLIM